MLITREQRALLGQIEQALADETERVLADSLAMHLHRQAIHSATDLIDSNSHHFSMVGNPGGVVEKEEHIVLHPLTEIAEINSPVQ